MDEATKRVLLTALRNHRGDDHLRAALAFRNYTPEQMQEEHGDSGRKRQEILDEANEHAAEVAMAMAWVEAQPPTSPLLTLDQMLLRVKHRLASVKNRMYQLEFDLLDGDGLCVYERQGHYRILIGQYNQKDAMKIFKALYE